MFPYQTSPEVSNGHLSSYHYHHHHQHHAHHSSASSSSSSGGAGTETPANALQMGGADASLDNASVVNETNMSINDHLSTMPMPWIDLRTSMAAVASSADYVDQRHQQRRESSLMLDMGAPPPVTTPSSTTNTSSEIPKSINKLAEEHSGTGSSETDDLSIANTTTSNINNSSSSCSPATPQHLVSPQQQHQQQQRMMVSDEMSELDRVVGNTLVVKPELDLDYMNMMQHANMHQMPLHLSFGRNPSAESCAPSTPAPTRRTRSSDGMLKCQFCPKKYCSDRELHRHMLDCRQLRTHECSICAKRFKARGGLQQHMRIHNNDKSYICTFCSKRFTQKSHLDQHERIHTGQKPFVCQYCGRAFRQRSQQLGHENTHTNHSTIATSSSSNTTSSGQRSEEVSRTSPVNHSVNGVTSSSVASSATATAANINMAAAAAMMQQHQFSNDLIGHLEHNNLHHPNSLTSLLALSHGDLATHQQMILQNQHLANDANGFSGMHHLPDNLP